MTAIEVVLGALEQRLVVCSPLISMDCPMAAQEIVEALTRANLLTKAATAPPVAPKVPAPARLGDMPEFTVAEALDFAARLSDDAQAMIGDKPSGASFFRSVGQSAKKVAATIKNKQRVSSAQARALLNWRGAVDKWL